MYQDFNQGNPGRKQYVCPKCGNTQFETDEFRATGGTLSKIFDVQNKKFTTVTCSRCMYTEIYKGTQSSLSNVFDLFFGG
ncbi:GTP-binding protein [Puteibacter caeruleilacunae]|nr:GTP-binding protein [Puteibacter caeruleilacunae]